jgi:hypothetical protein
VLSQALQGFPEESPIRQPAAFLTSGLGRSRQRDGRLEGVKPGMFFAFKELAREGYATHPNSRQDPAENAWNN